MLRGCNMKTGFMIRDGESGANGGPNGDCGNPESLASLPESTLARIDSLDASAGDVQRLEVMGLCQGRVVQVVKRGDPMIVRVLGTRIGLAAVLAERVRVRRDAPAEE